MSIRQQKQKSRRAVGEQTPGLQALKITGTYAGLAIVWIIFSDVAVRTFVNDAESLTWIQTAKGIAFVVVTGLLLFVILGRELFRVSRVLEENRESRRRLATLLNALPGMVYRCRNDIDWTMLYVSDGVDRLTGYSRTDFMSGEVSYGRIIHSDDREFVWRVVQESLYHRQTFQLTYRIIRRDGEERWVWEQGRGIFGDLGKVEDVEGLILDVTDREQAKKEIARARDEAVEALQLKSTFFANMSHEIRTPVNVLLGSAEILKEELTDRGSPVAAELVESMEQSGKRLLDTIDRILDVTKIESGTYILRPEPVDLAVVAKELVEEFRPLARRKNIQVAFESTTGPAVLSLDRHAIQSALSNLMDNAIKFTHDGMLLVSLRRNEKGAILVEVSDTGIGISKEYLARLFRSFSQEQGGMTRPYEGSGVGLAVSRGFVEMLGCRIRVASEKGEGTTFTIEFPPELETSGDQDSGGGPRMASG